MPHIPMPAPGPMAVDTLETVRAADRAPEAERAGTERICEQCGAPFQGRRDKRFCCDPCRTRFGRERKERAVQATIDQLAQMAGVDATEMLKRNS